MSVRKCIKADLSRLCFHFSVVLTHECGKVNFFSFSVLSIFIVILVLS